jgi:hypothetical protein
MTRFLLRVGAVLCVVAGVCWFTPRPAQALKAFRDQFEAKYVKADSKDPADMALATAFKEAKCNICHVGKNKKARNAYGRELAKFLNKETDKENVEKIRASLDKVAAMKSNKDPQAPTFGELIKQGKLPAGITK